MPRPAKRAKLLDDSDSEDGGVSLTNGAGSTDFKVNAEYARRFEYNKTREERSRLEEKYGNPAQDDEDEDDDSTSEEEDDEGELATEALDAEMLDVLTAIRNKDRRVYDKNVKFYEDLPDGDEAENTNVSKKEKSMNLREYHRKNLLSGQTGAEDEDDQTQIDDLPRSYAQEQEALKNSIVKEIHAVPEGSDDDSDDEQAFLVAKSKPSKAKPSVTMPNVESADKDPDTFLSNFMAARAWVPTNKSAYAPLESDDEDEDVRAEAFEAAYNLRFEDPNEANKKLMSHSRTAIEQYSVRRDELSGRQKARERDKQRKEDEKREKDEGRARLKKLMLDEMQAKAEKIREAANLRGKDFKVEEWVDVLNEDWDDSKWEQMLTSKFGDEYYADAENQADDEEQDLSVTRRKPQWDDDIGIKDIVPDFKDEDEAAEFSLSDTEAPVENGIGSDDDNGESDAEIGVRSNSTKKTSKDRKKGREDKKKAAKREHRIMDAAAQQLIDEDVTISRASSKKRSQRSDGPTFRYRQTSPTAYGLTPLEILAAEDAQLNNWVGLKKLYPFRDEEKKSKDKKRTSKKGRLREWRKETFGDRDGPQTFQIEDGIGDERIEKPKKKRKRKAKIGGGEASIEI